MKRDIARRLRPLPARYRESGRHAGLRLDRGRPVQGLRHRGDRVEGLPLFRELDRPNLMIKVPGTEPGLAAIPRLLAEGVNVNVTLLFSVARYEAVVAAHREGSAPPRRGRRRPRRRRQRRVLLRQPRSTPRSTRSSDGQPLRGQAAVANARAAYESFERIFRGPTSPTSRAGRAAAAPLWASTSTKNPATATLYVEELAGPDTVNTMPEATLSAFRDHGVAEDRLTGTGGEAKHQLQRLAPSRRRPRPDHQGAGDRGRREVRRPPSTPPSPPSPRPSPRTPSRDAARPRRAAGGAAVRTPWDVPADAGARS